jgi:subtilisin family serine protease
MKRMSSPSLRRCRCGLIDPVIEDGVGVFSAKLGGGLVAMSGTSMATLHVAGGGCLVGGKGYESRAAERRGAHGPSDRFSHERWFRRGVRPVRPRRWPGPRASAVSE